MLPLAINGGRHISVVGYGSVCASYSIPIQRTSAFSKPVFVLLVKIRVDLDDQFEHYLQ